MKLGRRVQVTLTFDRDIDASPFAALDVDGDQISGQIEHGELRQAFSRLTFDEMTELGFELSALLGLLDEAVSSSEPRQEMLL